MARDVGMLRMPVNGLGQVGVVKDLPAHILPANVWSDADNVRFLEGGARSLQSQRDVFTNAPYNPLWVKAFPPLSNPIWVYANDTRIDCFQNGVGHALLRNLPFAAAGERWQGSVFQGLGVFNQINNTPQLWGPMTTATALVDLTGWPANTRTYSLRSYRNFLIAMRIVDTTGPTTYPFRVRWSDAADPGTAPTTWIQSAANFAGQYDFAETLDYVMDGLTLGEAFVVYKEKSTWGLQFTGGSGVMRDWKIFDDSGILARDCVASFPGGHVVCTTDDIIWHTGAPGSAISIVKDQLREWVFSNLNYNLKDHCFMCANQPRREIWFFFVTGNATYANRVLMWDWSRNRIGLRQVAETPFADSGPVVTSPSDIWSSGF